MTIQSENLYKALGDRIRSRRTKAKITQQQLASKLGLSRTSIANIEAGQQNTPLHVLYEICVFLCVNPIDLLPPLEECQKSPTEIANDFLQEMKSEETQLNLAASALSKALLKKQR